MVKLFKVLVTLLLSLSFLNCGRDMDKMENRIIGHWIEKSKDNTGMQFYFGELSKEKGKPEGKITYISDGGKLKYSYYIIKSTNIEKNYVEIGFPEPFGWGKGLEFIIDRGGDTAIMGWEYPPELRKLMEEDYNIDTLIYVDSKTEP